jgi:signal transduction histidine kinase
VLFAAIGVLAAWQWRARRDSVAMWAAASFGALGVVVVFALIVPERPDGLFENFLQRVLIALLVLFPFLLYRFTLAFRAAPVALDRIVTVMTSVLVVWTFALPHRLPATGEPRPGWVWAYLVGFFVHWTTLSIVVTVRLWLAGRREPSVARWRMRMLALASATITAALFASLGTRDPDSGWSLAAGAIAFASAIFFWFGLAPPGVVRYLWRRPEQRRLQAAIQDLMRIATNEREIVERVLAPMAEIVGARAVSIRDAGGRELGRHERSGNRGADNGTAIEVPMTNGSVIVTTSRYAPFFGVDELALVRTLGALTGLALDRARLFAQEREARVALQKADQLKTDFIALAAHELRTPVTTIHGFVHTLHHLGDRIPPDQQEELKRSLEQQTLRMANLVEQLLDLSRLDAEAITVRPQRVDVSERLRELVRAAAGQRRGDVAVEVPHGLQAEADPIVLERVVTNLVTNALRYGETPIVVTAEQRDRHLRIVVEDRGRGVPPEFVPMLFERFARSERSRAAVVGTGLGLAIARSYARAHRGDLLYHDAAPHGARFELILPHGNPGNGK